VLAFLELFLGTEVTRELHQGSACRCVHRPLPAWQQVIAGGRDLVHAADPDVEETIKRTVSRTSCQETWSRCYRRRTTYIRPVRRQDGPRSRGIVTGGHGNETGG
jgi:hypothetical protein